MTLRESLASIPGALTNFLIENAPVYLNTSTSSSTPSSFSATDDGCEKSLPIPASLIKEQWQLIFNSDATVGNVKKAIDTCRELVLESNECSEERKWLVRHLVDLRFTLKELIDAELDPNETGPSIKTVVGHHFKTFQVGKGLQNVRNFCDYCTGIIWSVVQSSYICTDCKFLVHQKCIDNILRVCAHVVASERKLPITNICPEIGLAAQSYKCAECNTSLSFSKYRCMYLHAFCTLNFILSCTITGQMLWAAIQRGYFYQFNLIISYFFKTETCKQNNIINKLVCTTLSFVMKQTLRQ